MKFRMACLGLAVGGLLGGVVVAQAADLGSSEGYWSESRDFALTNTPIVDLNAVDKSLNLGSSTAFTLLSLDVSHDAGGKLHGYAQMQFKKVVNVTNQVVVTVTNPVVSTVTNQVVETVTNEVVSVVTNEVVTTVTNEVVTTYTNLAPPQLVLDVEVTGTNEVVETNEVGVVSTNEVPVTETNDWVHFVTNVVCTDAETNYEYLVSDVTLVTVRTNGVEPSAQYTLTFNDQSGAFTSPNPPFYSEDILVTGTNIVYQTNLVEVVSTNEELLSVTNEFLSIITNAICTTNDSTIETNYEYLLAPAEFVNLETNEIVITNCAGIEIKYEYIAMVTTGIPEEVTNLVVINETNLVSVEQTNLVTEDVTNLVASLVTNQVAGLSTNTTASLFGAVAGSVSGSVGKQKINLSVRALGYGIPTAGIGQSSASATLTLSGKVEQELVVLGGSCKLAVKGQPSQSITLSDLEWEPAYLSNTLMITSSLLPTKISGTDAKGNMHCAGQAVISTAADHGLYGNTVQVWEQSKNSLQEVGNFSGTGAERGASLHWKATRQLDQTQGNAVVSGRLLGQSFSQPVFFDWP